MKVRIRHHKGAFTTLSGLIIRHTAGHNSTDGEVDFSTFNTWLIM